MKPLTSEPPRAIAEPVDKVCLSLPADPRLFLLARMTGSSIATRADFSVEDIADLRLAIDELCTSCSEGSDKESTVALAFTWSDDAIRVECTVSPIVAAPRVLVAEPDLLSQSELSERILAALVDEYAIGPCTVATRSGHFVKHREHQRP